MSRLSIKLGYWSAILSIILGIGYGIGLGMLIVLFPTPPWTNLADFVAALQPTSLFCFTLCQVMMFLSAPLNMILFCSLHDYAPPDKKVLTRIGLCAMTATMVLGSQMYFVQFSTVRQNIAKGVLTGLEQFVQWNPNSVIMAIGMLGWTFFFGLAFIFVAPVFSGGRLEKGLRYAFSICGGCAVLGTIGFLLESIVFQLIYVMGITLAGTTAAVLASILFRRMGRASILLVPVSE
jgi:hypothetical protein